MKAMILAAGLGTRLRPLTNSRPKALLKINNTPLVELVLKRLIAAGVTDVVINLHHFPEQIQQFLQKKNYFHIHIQFSLEEKLLDTGGGLKKVRSFFNDDKPFFLHNVDIISDIDLPAMYEWHLQHRNLVTLAVKRRVTTRYLIFDERDRLCGWKSLRENRTIMTGTPIGKTKELGFCGIHVISPELFSFMSESGSFSIMNTYLRLTAEGKPIQGFRADNFTWYDVGKLDQTGIFKIS